MCAIVFRQLPAWPPIPSANGKIRPEVEECAIIGLPDQEWGERVTAFIVARQGVNIDPQALKAFLKSRISAFKVPKEFRVVNELPKSPAGKILKRQLRREEH